MHEASASSKRDGSGTVAQSANAILGRLFRVRSVINGSFAFSESVQPLSNPVRSIVCGRVPKNRAYGVPL
jgi:hypothetical protein